MAEQWRNILRHELESSRKSSTIDTRAFLHDYLGETRPVCFGSAIQNMLCLLQQECRPCAASPFPIAPYMNAARRQARQSGIIGARTLFAAQAPSSVPSCGSDRRRCSAPQATRDGTTASAPAPRSSQQASGTDHARDDDICLRGMSTNCRGRAHRASDNLARPRTIAISCPGLPYKRGDGPHALQRPHVDQRAAQQALHQWTSCDDASCNCPAIAKIQPLSIVCYYRNASLR